MQVRIHPQKSLQSFTSSQSNVETVTSVCSRKSKRNVAEPSAPVLPDHCIFCKKAKYKPKSKTREKTQSCVEFRADKTVRDSVLLHIEQCTDMCYVAQEVLGICSKGLISSEAKYHALCYKSFFRISYIHVSDKRNDSIQGESSRAIDESEDVVESVYTAAYDFCENLIKSPRV